MTLGLDGIPKALEPPVDLEGPASPVHLFSGPVTVHIGGEQISREASLRLKWLPHPRVVFEVHGLPITHNVGKVDEIDLEIPGRGVAKCRVFRSTLENSDGRFAWAGSGTVWLAPQWPEGFRAERLRFLVPNFHRYNSGGLVADEADDGEGGWRARLRLVSAEGVLILDQLRNAQEAIELLREHGGFAVTHIAELQLPEDAPVLQPEADDLLSSALFFLSFSRGLWSGYVLPVAFGSGHAWPYWRVTQKLKGWMGVSSWFPLGGHLREEHLSRSFSRFMELRSRELWRDPLTWAIHWYVEANCDAGGREGSLILAQTALELLSWLVLVEDRQTVKYDGEGFNSKKAEWRTRRLLEHCGIGTEVPEHLEAAIEAGKALQTHDGPALLANLRHALVHPKLAGRGRVQSLPGNASLEVRQLALQYVELVLLRILDYQGSFCDRTLAGAEESVCRPVPWSFQ